MHSEDLAKILIELVQTPMSGQFFNLGSGKEISIRDLFSLC